MYLFGYENDYQSVKHFLSYFEFIKPKKVSLEITETDYKNKYEEFTTSKTFREIMKRAEAHVKWKLIMTSKS